MGKKCGSKKDMLKFVSNQKLIKTVFVLLVYFVFILLMLFCFYFVDFVLFMFFFYLGEKKAR